MLFGVLFSLDIIAKLTLAGLLVFLCFKTGSKGLILISVILLTSGVFDWVFERIINSYVDEWMTSKMSGEETRNMTPGDFVIRLTLIKQLVYDCLCLLGGFLVYRDWRQGKFRQPSAEIQ